MIKKRFLCIVLSAAAVLASTAFSIPSVSAKDDFKYSPEYQSSPYYEKLTAALEDSAGKSAMEKTLYALGAALYYGQGRKLAVP